MCNPKSDLFDIVADIEARIGSLRFGDSYTLYELMYEAAARLGPIGCFYVCLYCPDTNTLHFAYNRDGDDLEEPITLPLGYGPTSWVIRHQRPFILTDATVETQRAGLAFGDRSRVSRSAAHLPMRTIGPDGRRQLVGVMSAQSYEPDAFGVRDIHMLQALADRCARILHHDEGHEDCRRRLSALEEELEQRHERAVRISSVFTEQLTEAANQAKALLTLTPGDHQPLREAELALYRSLHKVLTLAAEAPTHLDQAHPPLARHPEPAAPLAAGLTERELEIANLLASGRSNASIAESLYVSVDTVKFHCANLYRKLGVRNRVQAVQAAAEFIHDAPRAV